MIYTLPFALALFGGALLLFMVQPLMGKFILPWFGGGPAVWTTCMLFFQVFLLAGYAYAHASIRWLRPRRQVVLHLALLALALALLPITPSESWKPADGTLPAVRILVLLCVCLGVPYLVLSATGPLMQAWFSHAHPGASPYRLYALSNAGSLLALVSFPLFVEPHLSRHVQASGWSVGLAVFAGLAAWCGWVVWAREGRGTVHPGQGSEGRKDEAGPRVKAPWLWFSLPACASVLLLAVTNMVCQDIAVIPFLWVLPLSLYLVSFILAFDSPRWYGRAFWMPALVLALGAVLWMTLGPNAHVPDTVVLRPVRWLLQKANGLSAFKVMAIYLGTLFVCCMVCHGEVYRLRPAARDLTAYYLTLAAGGAFGGILVGVVAPLVFKGYFEIQAGLFAMGLLVPAVLFVDPRSPLFRGRPIWAWPGIALAVLGLGICLYKDARTSVGDALEVTRGFYGVLTVEEHYADDPDAHEVLLRHGSTTHGLQLTAPDNRRLPVSYYTPSSGIGLTMQHFPRQTRHVGVVGLGTGTMAAWSRPGDAFRIYEIDPLVVRLAHSRFTFLEDSPAQITIVPGDARLSMEREADQQFDILALDAFSSDAIPVHLLTREAFETYRRHLLPDGVIVVHISNRYLDLEPIVKRVADHFGFHAALIRTHESDLDEDQYGEGQDIRGYASDWVLLTTNQDFLDVPAIAEVATELEDPTPNAPMWTDEQSSLFAILVLDEDGWLGWLRKKLM